MRLKIKCPKCDEEFEMEINVRFGEPAMPKLSKGLTPREVMRHHNNGPLAVKTKVLKPGRVGVPDVKQSYINKGLWERLTRW